MNQQYTLLFVLILNVYSNAAEDNENKTVVLWYPLAMHIQQLRALAHHANFSKCHQDLLQKITPEGFALPLGYHPGYSQYLVSLSKLAGTPSSDETRSNSELKVRILSNPSKSDEENVNSNSEDTNTDSDSEYDQEPTKNFAHEEYGNYKDFDYAFKNSSVTHGDESKSDYNYYTDDSHLVEDPNNSAVRIDLGYGDRHNKPQSLPMKNDKQRNDEDSPNLNVKNNTHVHMNTILQEYMNNQGSGQDYKCNCTQILAKLLSNYLNEPK